MKYFLLFLCFPVGLLAQEKKVVEPVLSADYQQQLQALKRRTELFDSLTSWPNRVFRLQGFYFPYLGIKRVNETGDQLSISPYEAAALYLKGAYTASVEGMTHNRLPELQSTFVQGRPVNGSLAWRGAENNEVFSYGPALPALEYDGSSYGYDVHGRLVPAGTGNGMKPAAYNNSVFRTGTSFSQQFSLSGEFRRYQKKTLNFGLLYRQSKEQTIIRENDNDARTFNANLGIVVRNFSATGNYSYVRNRFSNSNRSGFLNQVYQNALLTPVSFSNEQGSYLGSTQRSYSAAANNPWFLLRDNDNEYRWVQHTAGLVLKHETPALKLSVTPSLLDVQQLDKEVYKAGAAFWPAGMFTDRQKHSRNYSIESEGRYYFLLEDDLPAMLSAKHLYTHEDTRIQYQPDQTSYRYRRATQEALFQFNLSHDIEGVYLSFTTGNRLYFSNTAVSSFFLPMANLTATVNQLARQLSLKIVTSYHRLKSELPVSQSLSHVNLLQYTTQQALQYRPVNEVQGYDGLKATDHTEWSGEVALQYKNRYTLNANVYLRQSKQDPFPVIRNGLLQLENLADVQKKGVDITVAALERNSTAAWGFSYSLGFFLYRNRVTRVTEGYEGLPTGGFSEVHTALVQGAPLGVIMGSDYRRNADGRVVIGDDGFPLADPQLRVIGNPNPDFTVKQSNTLRWKKLSLLLSWEWKKGGVAWNGTQAALDYYGRSAFTAANRNVAGYVFDGVLQNGHVNEIPVRWYDPARPVEDNRWVRYGVSGVAADYIQRADYLRINQLQLSYRLDFRRFKNHIVLSMYLRNLLLWSPYKGADPTQFLYGQGNTAGLDFFNLPGFKTYGFNLSLQF